MEKDRFEKAIRLNNQKSYLLKVKDIIELGIAGDSLDLRCAPCKFVTIKGTLLKKINEIVDEEIREIDQKIENL